MVHGKSHRIGWLHLMRLHIDKELLEISFFQMFLNLARSLLDLLAPVYLYLELGYTIEQVFLFFILWQLAFSLMMPFVGTLLRRFKIKHAIALRPLVSIFFWWGAAVLLQGDFVSDMIIFMPLFFLRALGCGVSEVAYDVFLAHHLHTKVRGRLVAFVEIATMVGAILSPIVGAVVMSIWGFDYVIYAAMFFFLCSFVVLFLTPDHKISVSYKPSQVMRDMWKETPHALYRSEIGRVFFDTVLWIPWPLFLVLVLPNVTVIGLVVGAASGIALFVAWTSGVKVDVKKKSAEQLLLRNGGLRGALANVFRGFIQTPVGLTLVESVSVINYETIIVPYYAEMYRWIHEKKSFERAHIRWIITENMYTLLLLLLLGFFWLWPFGDMSFFVLTFILSGVGLLLCQKIVQLRSSFKR